MQGFFFLSQIVICLQRSAPCSPLTYRTVTPADWDARKFPAKAKNSFFKLLLEHSPSKTAKERRKDALWETQEYDILYASHRGNPIGFVLYHDEGRYLSTHGTPVSPGRGATRLRRQRIATKLRLRINAQARSLGKAVYAEAQTDEMAALHQRLAESDRDLLTRDERGALERLPADTILIEKSEEYPGLHGVTTICTRRPVRRNETKPRC